jgi:hypothetical protein
VGDIGAHLSPSVAWRVHERTDLMDVRLNGREAELLRHALRQYVSDMSLEIGKTENYEWRQSLKDDKETLEGIVERVDSVVAEAAAAPDTVVIVMEARVVG